MGIYWNFASPSFTDSLKLDCRAVCVVPPQDVFLMVRRQKQTIFLDATEEVTVMQLKKKLEPIVKHSPEDQMLYNVDTRDPLDDNKTLGDCGYKAGTARAQDPASIGLAFRESEFRFIIHTPVSVCLCVLILLFLAHRYNVRLMCRWCYSDSLSPRVRVVHMCMMHIVSSNSEECVGCETCAVCR